MVQDVPVKLQRRLTIQYVVLASRMNPASEVNSRTFIAKPHEQIRSEFQLAFDSNTDYFEEMYM